MVPCVWGEEAGCGFTDAYRISRMPSETIGAFGLVVPSITNPYHFFACESPHLLVVLVWWGSPLPFVTILEIWAETYRVRPLPVAGLR